MNPYRHRVHNRKEAAWRKGCIGAACECGDHAWKASSQAEDIAGARAAERAEEVPGVDEGEPPAEGCAAPLSHRHRPRLRPCAAYTPLSTHPRRRHDIGPDPHDDDAALPRVALRLHVFGVLMLESGSPRFDIVVCLFTVVVIFLSHAIILGGDPSVSSDRFTSKTTPTCRSGRCRCTRSKTLAGSARAPSTRRASRSCCGRKRRARVRPPPPPPPPPPPREHPAQPDRHAGAELGTTSRPTAPSRAPPRLCRSDFDTTVNIDSHHFTTCATCATENVHQAAVVGAAAATSAAAAGGVGGVGGGPQLRELLSQRRILLLQPGEAALFAASSFGTPRARLALSRPGQQLGDAE